MASSPNSPSSVGKNVQQDESMMFVRDKLDEYGLDPYEFRLYGHIIRRTGGRPSGRFFASSKKTAEICKMSVRKVQYCLKFLCEAGFLTQEKRQGSTDMYYLTPTSSWANQSELGDIRAKAVGRSRNKTPQEEAMTTGDSPSN